MSVRRQQGFTLIELMIVLVIISILASIAIPNFIAMQNRAKEGSVKASMQEFQAAVEDYGVEHAGTYPTDVKQVISCLPRAQAQTNPFTHRPMEYNQSTKGNVLYESDGKTYRIRGRGTTADLKLVLNSGDDFGDIY